MDTEKLVLKRARDCARQMVRFRQLKAEGRCTRCGAPAAPNLCKGGLLTTCTKCNEEKLAKRDKAAARAERRELYRARKRAGRCTECGGPGRKVEGHKRNLCADCAAEVKARRKKLPHTPARKARDREVFRAKKQMHVCTSRGCNNLAVPGRNLCGRHLELSAERSMAYKARKKARLEAPDMAQAS